MFYLLKRIRQFVEAIFVWIVFIFFHYILPFNCSVDLGGWLGRAVGPRLPLSKRARSNLKKCFPHLTSPEIERIVTDMWDNYGRLAAEYANIDAFWDGKTLRNIEVKGLENLKHFQEDGKPGIIFSAHTGNWQMITLVAQSIGFDLAQMYRPVSNPWIDNLALRCQKPAVKHILRRNKNGVKGLKSLMRRGEHALLLIDQKVEQGISIPFLGRNAMAAKGVARTYLTENCALLPARSERLHDSHFLVTFYPPIEFTPVGDQHQDMYHLLLKIHTMIGEWIIERPSQWLWIHRRWTDS